MKMVTVSLRSSVRYAGVMYHPGEDVKVPQDLADALLLSPKMVDEQPVDAPPAAPADLDATGHPVDAAPAGRARKR